VDTLREKYGKHTVLQLCTLPLDMPCGGLLLKESERGSCPALPPLSPRPGHEAQ